MNGNAMQLYRKMQHDIDKLRGNSTCETAMIEGCFTIASHYWNGIKQCLESYLFCNETEEIHFFKNIKPLFIAAIEYYTLHYQAILFRPSHDATSLAAYWLHQLKRVETFYARHKDFYLYYTSGQTCSDSIYFIQRNNAATATGNRHPGAAATISYGHIAARIIGYQQYLRYVEQQLEILALSSSAYRS
jgi:hypothetical protein